MARSRHDTLIFATILLTPMAVAAVYIAAQPEPEPVVIVREILTPVETPPVEAPQVVETLPIEAAPAVPVHTPEPMPLGGAGMLVHDRQLVLSTAPDLTWSKGQIKAYFGEDGVTASKAVDPRRLPAELQAVADARVVFYDGHGNTCSATTSPNLLRIYGRQDGEVVYPEEGSDEVTPAQRREVQQQVFAEAQLLLARPLPPIGDSERCNGLWARRADLPAPAVFGRSRRDPDVTAEILAKIDEQPTVRALAAEYADYRAERQAYDDGVPTWHDFRKASMTVDRWDEIGGPRSFVNVVIGDGGEACSDMFSSRVAVLFALEEGKLVPQADAGFIDPVALMDLERDGHLEAVTEGAYKLESRGPAGVLQSFDFPYHGCPC